MEQLVVIAIYRKFYSDIRKMFVYLYLLIRSVSAT